MVEEERDLEFKHPIHVDFLSVKAFKKQVTADEDDLTDKDRKEIEQSTSMFRAMGLIEGEIDLFDSMNELQGAGVVGYYDYDYRTDPDPRHEADAGRAVDPRTRADPRPAGPALRPREATGQAGEGRRLRCLQRLRLPRRGRREPDRDGVGRGPEQGRAEGPRQVRGRAVREVRGRLRRASPKCSRRSWLRRTSSARRCCGSRCRRVASGRWTTSSARRPPPRSTSSTRGRWWRTRRRPEGARADPR